MNDWVNKVVVVTDCNELGISVINSLCTAGMIVIGFTNTETVIKGTNESLKLLVKDDVDQRVILYKCDVTNSIQLKETFDEIIEKYTGIDVLINNSICDIDSSVCTGNFEDFRKLIDTNIFSLVACTRFAAASMIERGVRGHIIYFNDLCELDIPSETKKSIFFATKTTTAAVNETLRLEFRYLKSNIKVSNIVCGTASYEEAKPLNIKQLKIKDITWLMQEILSMPEHLHVHEIILES